MWYRSEEKKIKNWIPTNTASAYKSEGKCKRAPGIHCCKADEQLNADVQFLIAMKNLNHCKNPNMLLFIWMFTIDSPGAAASMPFGLMVKRRVEHIYLVSEREPHV